MGRLIQWLLDAFHQCRRAMAWLLAYLSLRVFGLETASADVWQGAYSKRKHVDRDLGTATDLPGLLTTAKECLQNAQGRRSAVTDKCKTLLTVSSLLLGLIGLFMPRSSAFEETWSRIVFFGAVAALLNTVMLLLIFFDVGKETEISLDQSDVNLDADDVKKNLINLHLQCQVDMENRTDYLVDIYRTSRFFFLSAFTVIVILFGKSYLTASPSDDTQRFLRKLRSDAEMIELLRGPKGQKGETGENGKNASVDIDKVVERLLDHPKVKKGLANAKDDIQRDQSQRSK